jgi:hypothetical protein
LAGSIAALALPRAARAGDPAPVQAIAAVEAEAP